MITNKKKLASTALTIMALMLSGCGDNQEEVEQERLRPVRTILAGKKTTKSRASLCRNDRLGFDHCS